MYQDRSLAPWQAFGKPLASLGSLEMLRNYGHATVELAMKIGENIKNLSTADEITSNVNSMLEHRPGECDCDEPGRLEHAQVLGKGLESRLMGVLD